MSPGIWRGSARLAGQVADGPRHSPHLFSSQTRLIAVAFWNFLTFMLAGLVCILIGLQLPEILQSVHASFGQAVWQAAVVCGALVVLRMVWVFVGPYVPRIFVAVRKREREFSWRRVFLVAWVGMRGLVSLVAALALPERLPDGSALPRRNLILSFAVILATLVGPSLTLP